MRIGGSAARRLGGMEAWWLAIWAMARWLFSVTRMHMRMTPLVLFTPPWRLSPEFRRFQGRLPWLVEWEFARALLLSVKLEIVVRGRWTRWERRRISPRVYRPLPLPTL